MTYPMGSADAVAQLQAALDATGRAGQACTIPAGGWRLASTGLGYGSHARITMAGDLYNDHGPAVGTLYCLTNRTGGRLNNVSITGAGGAFVGANTPALGATRKGLGIVMVDGFTLAGVRTAGPLTGFGVEIKNATEGSLSHLQLLGGAKVAGADGLHFFGACQRVSGSDIMVASGDDALSFTCENRESLNATLERITLSNLTLNSQAFSCIKFFTSLTTGRATIRDVTLSGIKGRITGGPTGGPLIMQNLGAPVGCTISDVLIEFADLDFGAATLPGPNAYLTDISALTLHGVTLRGRRRGQFIRAVRCHGLSITGDLWETIPGSPANDLVQLERCGDYDLDLVVRSASGARTGSIKVSNTGTDSGTRYIGITGS